MLIITCVTSLFMLLVHHINVGEYHHPLCLAAYTEMVGLFNPCVVIQLPVTVVDATETTMQGLK